MQIWHLLLLCNLVHLVNLGHQRATRATKVTRATWFTRAIRDTRARVGGRWVGRSVDIQVSYAFRKYLVCLVVKSSGWVGFVDLMGQGG